MAQKKCTCCGHIHEDTVMTPHIDDRVHCPYDPEGKARMPGMEDAMPRCVVVNGIQTYTDPWRKQGDHGLYIYTETLDISDLGRMAST